MTTVHASSGLKPYVLRVLDRWRGLSLAAQFAIGAMTVLFCGMVILGAWVSHRIEDAVVHNGAAAAALYMDSLIKPQVQELTREPQLSERTHWKLDALLTGTPLGRRIVSVKIWGADGRIIYSSQKNLIGQKFPVSERLKLAFDGDIRAELEHLHDAENEGERRLGTPLLEIYAPIRDSTGDHRVIAVAEFYERADELHADLKRARRQSLLIFGGFGALMLALLSGIVRKGSKTIARQQTALTSRVRELSRLLAHNEELRERVRSLHRRAARSNEGFLRRVGSDLHDGPTQLVGLALLMIDGLAGPPHAQARPAAGHVASIRRTLADCLKELREIASGLVLPEIDAMPPDAVLRLAIENHEMRTGTTVHCEIDALPATLAPALKITLYRFVQEGLNNAFRHAGGRGQSVRATAEDDVIEVEVADNGPGLAPESKDAKQRKLGLAGLRDRIESLGGNFSVTSEPGVGTAIRVRFKLSEAMPAAGDEGEEVWPASS